VDDNLVVFTGKFPFSIYFKALQNKDTHRLPIIYNTQACLFHDGMQLLPGIAPISRSIDRACVGMHENDLVG
jgi:hypothetical protein